MQLIGNRKYLLDRGLEHASHLSAAGFEALGVYDPADPHAASRLELLEYLVRLGATADELVQYRDAMPGLAAVLVSRGGEALTLSEAVQCSGISRSKLLKIIRAAGFAEPDADDRAISERLVELAAGITAAEAIFGEQATLQLVRVMGSAMARLADAAVSAFLVSVEPAIREADPVGLEVARANAQAAALLPTASTMLEVLLRQHIIGARRQPLGDAADGFETQRMCVGFVDLVGSTALSQRLSTRELGSVLTAFEHITADVITAGGGRVVKLIGDEVMYVTKENSSALGIALNLTRISTQHPSLLPVHVGVAGGEVLLRDGDVFGPVVNLAARTVEVAAAGEVVMPTALAIGAGIKAEHLGRRELRGFPDDVELSRLRPHSSEAAGLPDGAWADADPRAVEITQAWAEMSNAIPPSSPVIGTRGLTKRLDERFAVDAVNLTIPEATASASSDAAERARPH